jgi:protoporphyrinogen IX oxidase
MYAWIMLAPALLRSLSILTKLACVAALLAVHGYALGARDRLLREPHAVPHQRFRVLNEVPTLLMIVIAVMVVVRPLQ